MSLLLTEGRKNPSRDRMFGAFGRLAINGVDPGLVFDGGRDGVLEFHWGLRSRCGRRIFSVRSQ